MTENYCCPAEVSPSETIAPSQETIDICNSFHVSKKPKFTFEFSQIKVGDIVVFISDGIVSKLIEKYIGFKDERTKYTHVAIYIGNGRIIHNNPYYKKIEFGPKSPRIITGVNCDILADKNYSRKKIRCFRFKTLNDCDRSSIAQNASQRIEEPYDIFPAIHSFILQNSNIFDPINRFGHYIYDKTMHDEISSLSNICSTFVDEVFYDSIGDRFPVIGNKNFQFPMPYDFVTCDQFSEIDLNVSRIG